MDISSLFKKHFVIASVLGLLCHQTFAWAEYQVVPSSPTITLYVSNIKQVATQPLSLTNDGYPIRIKKIYSNHPNLVIHSSQPLPYTLPNGEVLHLSIELYATGSDHLTKNDLRLEIEDMGMTYTIKPTVTINTYEISEPTTINFPQVSTEEPLPTTVEQEFSTVSGGFGCTTHPGSSSMVQCFMMAILITIFFFAQKMFRR